MRPADRSNSPRIVVSTLTLLVAGCPQDVALPEDTSSTGASTSTTGDGVLTGAMTGTASTSTSDPTTGGPPMTGGDPTGGNETANLGDTTTASGSSSGSSTGEDAGSSTTGADASSTSTSDPSTTTSTTTSTGGDTSTGGSGGDGTTTSSSGDGTSSDGSSDASSSDAGTSSGDSGDDTGEQPPIEQALSMCCEAGCSGTLFQSARSDVVVSHNGTRIFMRDNQQALLWDADSLALIARFPLVHDVSRLQGDRLLYRVNAELHVVDAVDGAELGVCPAGSKWGLAPDGSYLWTVEAEGLSVRETDCSVRWKLAGPLADARLHGLPDAMHVFDKDLDPAAVLHIDAITGIIQKSPFVGDFPHWFEDSARYWTQKKAVYRMFAADGTELFTGEGYGIHGWGTRVAIGNDVFDISAPGVKLATIAQYGKFVGPVITSQPNNNKLKLTRLDTDPVSSETITLPCCGDSLLKMSFDIIGDKWVVGGENGMSADHLGRPITVGDLPAIAGSPTGRLTFAANLGRTYVYDVADDCTATVHPWFPRFPGNLWIAGDGDLLISQERYEAWPLQNPPHDGTRFYSMPEGELLASTGLPLHSSFVYDHDISDDGTVWSRTWATAALPAQAHSGSFPFGESYTGAVSDVLPKIAPDGQHIVISDGVSEHLDDWVGDQSHVHLPDEDFPDPIASFDGIAHGFIDDTHILVGHYGDPNDTFLGSEIVDITGLVVQTTDLPDIRRLYRIGTGEILAQFKPFNLWAIFDPWTGVQLWSAGPASDVAPVGEDFVAVVQNASVKLVRWR